MHKDYSEFISHLEREDREGCIMFVVQKLSSGELDIPTLYTEILAPSINSMECTMNSKRFCVWKEHVRSSILRTVIENCYPYVIRERDKRGIAAGSKGKAVIVCPPDELHEIGARMAADFFTILGADAVFIGANTPVDDIVAGIEFEKPDYVCISVANYYNVVAARKIIKMVRAIPAGPVRKIIVGGYAFRRKTGLFREIGADLQADSFDEIQQILSGGC